MTKNWFYKEMGKSTKYQTIYASSFEVDMNMWILISHICHKTIFLLTTPNTPFYNFRDTVFKRPTNVTSRKFTETDNRKRIHKKKIQKGFKKLKLIQIQKLHYLIISS